MIIKEHFLELCLLYPEVKTNLVEELKLYQDKNKQW